MSLFDVQGVFHPVIITPMPANYAVNCFIADYCHALSKEPRAKAPNVLRAVDTDQLFKHFDWISLNTEINTVILVTHGYETGQPETEDYDIAKLPDQERQWLYSWERFSSLFMNAFDNRILMLAVCDSGQMDYPYRLTHDGFAQHVITPLENTKLYVPQGSQAMAAFSIQLARLNSNVITPNDMHNAMDRTEKDHPGVLDLWSYASDRRNQKYIPLPRRK